MTGWLERLASELGEEALDRGESERILQASRDVAHKVERRLTPLSMFLLGEAVGRALATGAARDPALDEGLRTLHRLVPAEGASGDEEPRDA